MISFHFHW